MNALNRGLGACHAYRMHTLDLDGEQRALAATVKRFCEDSFRGDGEVIRRDFDTALWRRLADLGVLMVATKEGGGGAVHLAAAMEQLGRAGFAGPLTETFAAGLLLPEDELAPVMSGERLVTLAGSSTRVPWAPIADIFIKVEADGFAYRAAPASPVTPLKTLGGVPWGTVELDASDRLGLALPAHAIASIATAAYLAGAGQQMVDSTAEYVHHRRQFGRSLGEFQGVSHPLADCHARVVAARDTALLAAHHYDHQAEIAPALASAARLSATDAVTRASYICHQAMGGMGFVEGTLLSVLTRASRVLTLAPPGLDSTRETALGRFLAPARA
jgi:alkylation response protein AidB-like acyl-CoA dehydrogenase